MTVSMTTCVSAEDKIVAEAQQKLSRNQQLKDSAQEMCEQFNKGFVEATLNRVDEINTLEEVLMIIKRKTGGIPESFHEYLQSVKNHWNEYVNSSEFRKYEALHRETVADNEHGRELSHRSTL
jgi:hypothetical protein